MADPQIKSMIFGAFFILPLFSLLICRASPDGCLTKVIGYFTYAICRIDSFHSLPSSTYSVHLICYKDSPFSLQRLLFKKFHLLRKILFLNCTFARIEKQAFEDLPYLEKLLIYNSTNVTLPPKFFNHIRKLKRLTISQSDLKNFSVDDLCLLNNIISINFSKNSIKEIVETSPSCPENSFSQLKWLLLNENKIRILRKGFAKRFQNITHLGFCNNQIEEIQNGSLVNLPQLHTLNISQNYIKELPDDFCAGCSELFKLNISQNQITELPTSFNKLQNLRKFQAQNTLLSDISILVNMSIEELNVQNCRLNTIPFPFCGKSSILQIGILKGNKLQDIPANIFKQCSGLKDLDLSVNYIESLNENSFNGLDKLVKLDLSTNNLSHIDNITFHRLHSLRYLNLSDNVLKENLILPENIEILDFSKNQLHSVQISNVSLFESQTLKSLNLEMNHIKQIDNVCKNCIYLQELNLKHNELSKLHENGFVGVIDISLLNIAYNNIEDVHTNLQDLMHLKRLHMEHNRLSTLNRKMFPPYIEEIYLSNNKIKTIEKGTFQDLKYLKNVDLRWNELVMLDYSNMRLNPYIGELPRVLVFGNPLTCDCHLASLKNISIDSYPKFPDLAPSECLQDDIHYIEPASFNPRDQQRFVCGYKNNSLFNLPFPCYLKCQCCLTENCLCQHNCAGGCRYLFKYDFTEFRVDCKNKKLTDGTGIPHNAILVDLSANELGYMTKDSFSGKTMTETLYLNRSKITGIGAGTFINFNRLKELHLEYNDITILDSSHLLGLQNLNKLILNHNKIERILPGTFNVTPNLEILDLSHNNLRKIESQTFDVDHLKSILLSDNPWSCECEDLNTLKKFLNNRIQQIDSPENVLCDRTGFQVTQYNTEYCHKKTLNLIHINVISICVAIVFLLGTAAIVYVYHTKIQMLLFVRFGWRILTKQNQLNEEDKKYDAFVSYHNSQDKFVINEMLPRLEINATPAYKLCVHFRDFPVGAAIVDNIIESIENSKRTILLLTNEFLTSEWCRYEFQAAHLESLSNKMNSLIVVLLEDIDSDLVDGGLKLYIKTKTYLKYDDPRFWDKLRLALPEKKQESKL